MATTHPSFPRGASDQSLAAAPTGAAKHDDHAHLLFDKITLTREMTVRLQGGAVDPDTKLTVVCEATPNRAHLNRHDRTIYQIAITRVTARPDEPIEFSALTLGLQGTRHTICIRSLRSENGDAVFIDGDDQEHPLTIGKCLEVPPTILDDAPQNKPDKNPVDGSIWFLRFSGSTCYVEAFALDRVEDGRIIWTAGPTPYGVGHDNTPPPAEPS